MSLSEYKAMRDVSNLTDYRRVQDEERIRQEVRRELIAEEERNRLASQPVDRPPAAPESTEVASYVEDGSVFEPRGLTDDQLEMAAKLEMDLREYEVFESISNIDAYREAHNMEIGRDD